MKYYIWQYCSQISTKRPIKTLSTLNVTTKNMCSGANTGSLPLPVNLSGVECCLQIHGFNPVDEGLEDIRHVFERTHVQHRQNVWMLVIMGTHQRQSVVQEVSSSRHHPLTSRQKCCGASGKQRRQLFYCCRNCVFL